MVSFRRRLGERAADVLDWVDYRPDADFRAFFVLPPLLCVAWAYGGTVGLSVLLGFALAVVLCFGALFAVGISAWIVANALLDVVPLLRPRAPIRASVPASAPYRLR